MLHTILDALVSFLSAQLVNSVYGEHRQSLFKLFPTEKNWIRRMSIDSVETRVYGSFENTGKSEGEPLSWRQYARTLRAEQKLGFVKVNFFFWGWVSKRCIWHQKQS